MKNSSFYLMLSCFILMSCSYQQNQVSQDQIEQWKQEIIDAENAFCEMSEQEGIAKAFAHFADDSAVLSRRNELVKGKLAIVEHHKKQILDVGELLSWEPTFVDVAASGDLGYTYGPFVYRFNTDSGTVDSVTGYFHTVWKRQEDGSWKYVWD